MSMKSALHIVLYLWQLPQNLLGLLFMLFLKPAELVRDTGYARVYRSRRMSGGISLGQYAYVSYISAKEEDTIRHEGIGHSRQSRMLGPLYLPVIGLPSLIWTQIYRLCGKSYYWFYTERWADRLGGVER